MTELKKTKSDLPADLEIAKKQFDEFDNNIKQMTLDRSNEAPKQEHEPQTKLSSKELNNSHEIYLKPVKTIGRRDKFNENFRNQYNFDKELVRFIAENKEILGEDLELWTGKYGGVPVEFWRVPTNKPVWGPRYLAEQIKNCKYHRFIMRDSVVTEQGGYGQMYGSMAVDTTVQRLDAIPAKQVSRVFMGASNF